MLVSIKDEDLESGLKADIRMKMFLSGVMACSTWIPGTKYCSGEKIISLVCCLY